MTPDPEAGLVTNSSVKAQAATLGFDLCGIAPVDDFQELAFLDEWLNRGYAGEMAWITRTAERRRDVRAVMPQAQSVIVTGTLYNTDRPYSIDQPAGVARISRYAWGDDYHDVLKPRLDALVSWMRTATDRPFDALTYVDTGPVQERVYAQYAGLGWIGKNTCLINPELGSWLFLSEIICTLPLEPDTQGLEQCGSCTRCLDACPTAAFESPGRLDPRRCIAYLTIEHRGPIAQELAERMGERVGGCDVCQEVCPYNQSETRAERVPEHAWLRPPPGHARIPDLVRLAVVGNNQHRQFVKHTPLTRIPRKALRRNAIVALGNREGPASEDELAALREAAADPAPELAELARWAAARRGATLE
jgi:epoxyqueuosine reductase